MKFRKHTTYKSKYIRKKSLHIICLYIVRTVSTLVIKLSRYDVRNLQLVVQVVLLGKKM